MYRLYRLGRPANPAALWLHYDWTDSFSNTAWRSCVEHFLDEVAAEGHEVVALPSPEFVLGEDLVEIAYLVDGKRVGFSSDHLLSLIVIEPDDSNPIRSVWQDVGNKVGWVGE